MADDPLPPLSPAGLVPASTAVTSTGLEPNVAAGLACLFPLIGGIVFLLIEKTNAFVRFYAMQSIFLTCGVVIMSVLIALVSMILGYVPFLGGVMVALMGVLRFLLSMAWLVLWVVLVVKAFSKVEWEIPVIGPLARAQLGTKAGVPPGETLSEDIPR